MYLRNNLLFDIYTQHVIDDVQYPRGWFTDASNRAALDVIEVPDPVMPDDDLFTTSVNPDGSITATPRTEEEIAARVANKVAQARAEAKAARAAAVEAIEVTTAAGNTFQGDEVSQGRMSRAILVLSAGVAPSVPWVLADNTTINATATELMEALALAGTAQSAIWVIQ